MNARLLGNILIAKFESWHYDGGGDLLCDKGLVIDHLIDDGYEVGYLMAIPESVWDAAWKIFESKMK